MGLKVIQGFQIEIASELSLMSVSSINSLRKNGLVSPAKSSVGYRYSFADVLTLRIIRQLRENGVSFSNIKKAHEYLAKIEPSKNLFNLEIAVRKDTGEVIEIGENLLVNLSKHGQLNLPFCHILPIGKTLEPIRQNVLEFDRRMSRVPKRGLNLEELRRKYA